MPDSDFYNWWRKQRISTKWLAIGTGACLLLGLSVLLVAIVNIPSSSPPDQPPVGAAREVTPDAPARNGKRSHVGDKVDPVLKELDAAKVAFNPPERARAGKSVFVEAVLSMRLSPDKLKSLVVESGGDVTVYDLKVSDRMVAALSGGSAFDVSPTTPAEQWISEKEPTRWAWVVTPKAVGEQFLVLSFDAVISIDGKDDKRSITTLRRQIDVEVGWPETWGEWLELARKTAEDISYLWAAILLPIGAGAWALFKRNRSTKTNGRDGDAIC